MAENQETVRRILRSEQAAGWRARLTAVYFDAEARAEALQHIRQAVADLHPAADPAQLADIQEAALCQLDGLASRDAVAPEGITASATALLEDRIIDEFPQPIAAAYRRLTEQRSDTARFGCLLDTFEGLLHFLGSVVVGAFSRSGLKSPDCCRYLLDMFFKERWSTGGLFGLVRDVIRLGGEDSSWLPYPELGPFFFARGWKPTPSHRVLESFVQLRNRAWGHGTGRDEQFYANILPANRERLEQELGRMGWLTSWQLVLPNAIDEAGRVTNADLLTGERPRQKRAYRLQLAKADLEWEGGDVRAGRTLLLVSPDARQYFPLPPMGLFHFHLKSQGVYFLSGTKWGRSGTTRRLQKCFYASYQSGLGELQEGPGDLGGRSLERLIRDLQGQVLEDAADAAPDSPEEPSHELPGVRLEQEFHLRTFAGRESVLRGVGEWIDHSDAGGYLVLLGPPGQGKSALMAEIARREGERGGCLLHMIKSHRNPLRFLPSLITQGGRLAKAAFGPDAYAGGIDDLRNSLLRALEAVRDRVGKAVLVIDALDEMEVGEDRVTFLPEILPPGVRAVLTCRPDIPLVHTLRARLRDLEERDLPPLGEHDLPHFLKRRLDDETARALEGAVDWSAVFRRVQGNPLFLQRALDRISRQAKTMMAEKRPIRIDPDELPHTLIDLFQDIYNEVGERGGTPRGRERARLLQFLCRSREAVGFEDLSDLATADGMPLTVGECRDRVFEMSQYLLDSGRERFKPWHQGLADFVRERVLGEAGCRQVEELFARWLESPTARRTPYGLRHRARHLIATERFDELAALLSDLPALAARVEGGMVFDVLADFAEALRAWPAGRSSNGGRPWAVLVAAWKWIARRGKAGIDGTAEVLLRLLAEGIQRDAAFLDRHRGCLFQSLWNLGWWYDAPPRGPGRGSKRRRLSALLAKWRSDGGWGDGGRYWLQSLVPPALELGSPLVAVMRGHEGAVTCVSCSTDGRRIASGSLDATVRLWDATSGAELAILRGHERAVRGVAFAPDGHRLASASDDQTIRLWDLDSGRSECWRGHTDAVLGVAFTGTGRTVVSGAADGTIRLWDADTGTPFGDFSLHTDAVRDVAVACDGRHVVSASADGTAVVWDSTTNTQLAVLEHEDSHGTRPLCGVAGVALGGDDSVLATVADDAAVRVWVFGDEVTHHRVHEGHSPVACVAVSPQGDQIATGTEGGGVQVWSWERIKAPNPLQDSVFLPTFPEPTPSPDTLGEHDEPVTRVAFTPSGRVVSASEDGTVRVWDPARAAAAGPFKSGGRAITCVQSSPCGRHLVAATESGVVRRVDWRTGAELRPLRGGQRGAVRCLAFSPDGRQLASASDDGTVCLWDATAEHAVARTFEHTDAVRCVALSATGELVAAGSDAGVLRVWGGAATRHTAYDEAVRCVAFSPAEPVLASGSDDGTIRLSDDRGRAFRCLKGHTGGVTCLAFSRDGRLLASGSGDGTVRVWDVRAGNERHCLRGHPGRVSRVAFSPDGLRVVSSSPDQTRVWRVGDGGCERTFDGAADVRAVASGRCEWVALGRAAETAVASASGTDVAWYPAALTDVVALPDGRTWAGAEGRHLHLFRLVGGAGGSIGGQRPLPK